MHGMEVCVYTVAGLPAILWGVSSLAVTVMRLAMNMVLLLSLDTGFCKLVTNMS